MKLSQINEHKKYYHATSPKNLDSILKNGLVLGHKPFGSIMSGVDYTPNIRGIYLGSLRTAMFYAGYIEHVCMCEIGIGVDSVDAIDEASLRELYTRMYLEPDDDLYPPIAKKLLNIYNAKSRDEVWNLSDQIIQDAADGKLDIIIKNKDVIEWCFDRGWSVVIENIPPSDIDNIWMFRYNFDQSVEYSEEMGIDTESWFHHTVENGFDENFWKKII
jgi:hypothetical protein